MVSTQQGITVYSDSEVEVVEKNTFLHFHDISEASCEQSKSRSSSAPAFTRFKMDSCAKPSSQDFDAWVEREDVRVLMIRGIPCSCTEPDVLQAMEEIGFVDCHDLFHVPKRRGKTIGYAFVGFPTVGMTKEFAKSMNGYRFNNKRSTKIITVVPALDPCVAGFASTCIDLSAVDFTHKARSVSEPLVETAYSNSCSMLSSTDRSHAWMDARDDVRVLMIRGIPCSCTELDILQAMKDVGFVDRHDFLHAPMRRGKTIGYAFVGFPTTRKSREFAKSMNGYRFKDKKSTKVITIVPASVQGVPDGAQDLVNSSENIFQ